jgi:hypothetical protein
MISDGRNFARARGAQGARGGGDPRGDDRGCRAPRERASCAPRARPRADPGTRPHTKPFPPPPSPCCPPLPRPPPSPRASFGRRLTGSCGRRASGSPPRGASRRTTAPARPSTESPGPSCPISTGGGTRRVRSVRGAGGGLGRPRRRAGKSCARRGEGRAGRGARGCRHWSRCPPVYRAVGHREPAGARASGVGIEGRRR